MTEKSNKAFGVNELKPNTSHLIPGKTGDGSNADPLTTGKYSRQEVDELIQLGKEARGELKPMVLPEEFKNWGEGDVSSTPVEDDYKFIDTTPYGVQERLTSLENKFEELQSRLVKAFKHAGFNF
jgi:hypothetical protein